MSNSEQIANLEQQLKAINKDIHYDDWNRVNNELSSLLYSFKEVDDTGDLTIAGNVSALYLNADPIRTPVGLTATLLGVTGNINNGLHYYKISYYNALGETVTFGINNSTFDEAYGVISISALSTSGQVQLTFPNSTHPEAIGKKIYRTKANALWYIDNLLTTIPDNTTTTYIDNVADASLTAVTAPYMHDRFNKTYKYLSINDVQNITSDFGITTLGKNAGRTMVDLGYALKNTFIGYNAGLSIGTASNNILIGQNVVGYTNVNSILNIGNSITGDLSTGNVRVIGTLAIKTSAPASATATGTAGTITYDSSYMYVCVATNSWKRASISAW